MRLILTIRKTHNLKVIEDCAQSHFAQWQSQNVGSYPNPSTFSFNHRSGDIVFPEINWVEPLKMEVAHFVDCIQSGTECLTDAKHAEK